MGELIGIDALIWGHLAFDLIADTLGYRTAILRYRSVNAAPYRRHRGIRKGGRTRGILHADPYPTTARLTGGVGSCCKRSRAAIASLKLRLGVPASLYTNRRQSAGPEAVGRGR
jgi:hypothetical protein